MTEVQDRLKYLINQYANQASSESEEKEFFALISQPENDHDFRSIVMEIMSAETIADIDHQRWEPILKKVFESEQQEEDNVYEMPVKHKTISWKRFAAAAVVIGIIVTAAWFVFKNKGHQPQTETIASQKERFKNDVLPGSNTPQLILADGRTVNLDNATTGALATEGTVSVTRLESGEIVYDAKTKPAELRFNTINNPRGSKVVPLTLSDGTKVWLDAGTSITYPTAFVGKERKVEITGQAYFEVAHNAAMPFVLKKTNDDVEVRVLGTHFNVNAFDDDESIKVTLLEGSVKVTKGINSHVIKPGQQAQIDKASSSIQIVPDVNIDQTMAWKNGIFKFDDITIEALMKQLARWYDVDVVYEDKPTEHFVSTIPRNVPSSEAFKILETTGRVHFKIDGKKVTVMK